MISINCGCLGVLDPYLGTPPVWFVVVVVVVVVSAVLSFLLNMQRCSHAFL